MIVARSVRVDSSPARTPSSTPEYHCRPNTKSANVIPIANPATTGGIDLVVFFDVGTSGPVRFTDGSPSSGLIYTFTSLASATDDIEFSNDGGSTYTYVPVADGAGLDADVTHIRIRPRGSFQGFGAFTVEFKAGVK